MDGIQIRLLEQRDSLDALTVLLHRAYGELGAMGFRYKAVDQSVSITRARIADGECYVAVRTRRSLAPPCCCLQLGSQLPSSARRLRQVKREPRHVGAMVVI
jgi:hypothetical protein